MGYRTVSSGCRACIRRSKSISATSTGAGSEIETFGDSRMELAQDSQVRVPDAHRSGAARMQARMLGRRVRRGHMETRAQCVHDALDVVEVEIAVGSRPVARAARSDQSDADMASLVGQGLERPCQTRASSKSRTRSRWRRFDRSAISRLPSRLCRSSLSSTDCGLARESERLRLAASDGSTRAVRPAQGRPASR